MGSEEYPKGFEAFFADFEFLETALASTAQVDATEG